MRYYPFYVLLNLICWYFVEDVFLSTFMRDMGYSFLIMFLSRLVFIEFWIGVVFQVAVFRVGLRQQCYKTGKFLWGIHFIFLCSAKPHYWQLQMALASQIVPLLLLELWNFLSPFSASLPNQRHDAQNHRDPLSVCDSYLIRHTKRQGSKRPVVLSLCLCLRWFEWARGTPEYMVAGVQGMLRGDCIQLVNGSTF